MASDPDSFGKQEFEKTRKTALRRKADRGAFDKATVHSILDEALLAHVGFPFQGTVSVLPMAYGRVGDTLYFHGSAGNALLKAASQSEVCVTVTLLDGLVLARSTFHHSMNYRSVVMYGRPRLVEEPGEKAAALAAITEHLVPGRTRDARAGSPRELTRTGAIALDLQEVSAKVRAGPPVDDEADMALPCWAGVIPLQLTAGAAIPDAATAERELPLPAYAARYERHQPGLHQQA